MVLISLYLGGAQMKCKMTTLSPVHIGGGENKVISPYSDYVYHNSFVYLIENKKLVDFLKSRDDFSKESVSDRETVFEKYLTQIKTDIRTARGRNIGDFFKYTLREDFRKFSYSRMLCEFTPKNQKIDLFQKTNGKPFIPGSTLKGAIRTAILFDYFNHRKNEVKLDDRNWIKNWENWLLGRGKDDIMKFLQITDSEPIDEETEVAHCERVNVNSKKQSIPQNYETLSKDVIANLEIISKAEHKHTSLYPDIEKFKLLFKNNEICIFDIINQFSRQNIEFELSTFKKYNSNGYFNNIIVFYQQLLNELNNSKDTSIMRIGKGKTFFDNSISGMFRNDKTKMMIIRNLPKRKIGYSPKGRKFVEPFPITRTLIIKDNKPHLPLGWIKISVVHSALGMS